MAIQRSFACSDCGYEFYEDQNTIEAPESQWRCPKCGSSNIDELDYWGFRKHKNSNWLFDQIDENDSK